MLEYRDVIGVDEAGRGPLVWSLYIHLQMKK